MTTEIETEAVLSIEDLHAILEICSTDGVLVGGQALGFWADHFDVQRPTSLEPAVSADADFIADADLARKLAQALGWNEWIATMDDSTFQVGKVTQKQPDGSIKQIDILDSVAGLTTRDVVGRALEMDVPEIGRLRVMHPVDVLDSRIQNLDLIPSKRTPTGVSQAQLALDVARRFMCVEIAERGERESLAHLERIAEIATRDGAIRVFLRYGIDPLLAAPIEEFRMTTALRSRRWPQIVRAVNMRREKVRRLQASRRKKSKQ